MRNIGSATIRPTTFADYLAILRRRKWIVLEAIVIVPLVAVFLAAQKPALYRASAQVLISRQNLGAELSGIQDPTLAQDPARLAQTQAYLARASSVARRAVEAAGVRGETAGLLLASSSVTPTSNADLLVFSVTHGTAAGAIRLVTAYATAFTNFAQTLSTAHLESARSELANRLGTLRQQGDAKSSLYSALVQKEQQLRELELLQPTNTLVGPALSAEQIQPRAKRSGLLGFLFGILIGLGLAFLWEALDQRVRSEDEIESTLALPVLGRLPEPSRELRSSQQIVMLAEPSSPRAEPFRRLRASFEFANLGSDAQTVLITSAVQREGKTTTAANLAVALARAGRHVVLVDLDLRQPKLGTIFDAAGPGVTDVAVGNVSLDEALTKVLIAGSTALPSANGSSSSTGRKGTLEILPAGSIVGYPGEFVGSDALTDILNFLRARSGTILIDAPPLLGVGDSMALAAQVDALLIVTRLRGIARKSLHELARVLERIPGRKIGFVITGAEPDERDGYGYAQADEPEWESPGDRLLTS